MAFFAHFQDLVDAYVGTFATVAECEAHADFCKNRGDSARYLGAIDESAVDADAGDLTMTPEQDRAWVDPIVPAAKADDIVADPNKVTITLTVDQLRVIGEALMTQRTEANAGNLDECAPGDFEQLDYLADKINDPELASGGTTADLTVDAPVWLG